MVFTIQEIADLDIVAQELIKYTEKYQIFCFFGEVGAGKTTLITSFCKELGVKDEISSPTYSIVQEYVLDNKKLYHIDLYRLNSEEEAFDIGLEDYLYSGAICLVEWPDNFLNLMPANYISVQITDLGEHREITVSLSIDELPT